ncbi:hypothetical protein GCM10025865_33860 (plasmid) [Paraoerskovia sediminicola]|uniref:Uncharacterized protein n=1 Tax=Paraoerskovia sediminicola TaxID=1138587 RepID=A0ABM8G7L2_9CELL|nr:hypothetical protein GCM10025865_33860 [Paraoerskovia sediminicola]
MRERGSCGRKVYRGHADTTQSNMSSILGACRCLAEWPAEAGVWGRQAPTASAAALDGPRPAPGRAGYTGPGGPGPVRC